MTVEQKLTDDIICRDLLIYTNHNPARILFSYINPSGCKTKNPINKQKNDYCKYEYAIKYE